MGSRESRLAETRTLCCALATALAAVASASFAQPQGPQPQGPPAPAPAPEAVIKAKRISMFPPFVQWPEAAFESPGAAFSICILGADPFGPVIDEAVRGQKVGPHPIEVKRLAKVEKPSSCHLLYLGARGPVAAEALAAVKEAPVLTVTDADGPDDPRGIIDFRKRGRDVRFAVDQEAARKAGLVVSSKLLSLAVTVRHRRPGAGG